MTKITPKTEIDRELDDETVCRLTHDVFFAHDWSATPLGPSEAWDPQLRSWAMFMLASAHPMFVVWGAGRTLLFNDACNPILGAHCAAVLGAPMSELWAGALSPIQGFLDEAFNGNTGIIAENPLCTPAGDMKDARYFTFSYSPIHDLAGDVLGAACMLTDTTAAVRSKEALRRDRDALHVLFQQAPSFMALVDGPEHRFTFANAAFHRLVKRTGLIGSTIAEMLPELVVQGMIPVLDKVYDGGAPFVSYGLPLRLDTGADDAGESIYIEIVCQPVIGGDGEVTGIFIEGEDVSERYSARERISVLQNELTLASQNNGMATMASTLAHELNQPLTVIHSYMSAAHGIAQRQAVDPLLLRCYAETRDAALRAGEIIRRLRDLTAYGYIRRERLDLEVAVRDAVSLVMSAESDMTVETDFQAKSPVSGDRIQIQQVLFNLVRNACESARDGHCALTITTRDKGPVVEVCVMDNGPGIEAAILPNMFEPFNTTKPNGMGVGLSICRTIIEAHGGTMSASNRAGGGASICFTLDCR